MSLQLKQSLLYWTSGLPWTNLALHNAYHVPLEVKDHGELFLIHLPFVMSDVKTHTLNMGFSKGE